MFGIRQNAAAKGVLARQTRKRRRERPRPLCPLCVDAGLLARGFDEVWGGCGQAKGLIEKAEGELSDFRFDESHSGLGVGHSLARQNNFQLSLVFGSRKVEL